jgi:hypothetical protein
MNLKPRNSGEATRRSVIGIPATMAIHDRYYFLSKRLKVLLSDRRDLEYRSLNEIAMERIEEMLDEVEAFLDLNS